MGHEAGAKNFAGLCTGQTTTRFIEPLFLTKSLLQLYVHSSTRTIEKLLARSKMPILRICKNKYRREFEKKHSVVQN